MKSFSRVAAAALLVAGLVTPCRAGQVKLEIRNGLVTLDAKDATVREILAEWARVGQTRIVNAERVSGGTVTLQLTSVPEAKVLDILLRSVAGYMAAPRLVAVNAGSRFDRILIMAQPRPAAGVQAPPSGSSSGNPVPQPPVFENRQRMMGGYQPQPSLMVDDQDEPVQPQPQPPQFGAPPPTLGAAQPGVATPLPQGMYYPNPQQPQQQQPMPQAQPGAPMQAPAAPRPGVVTQPPRQPGGPGGTN